MTQEEFEESMERIMAPVKARAEAKLDQEILKNLYQMWKESDYPYFRGEPDLRQIIDEIYTLLGDDWDRQYQIDEIRFLAYCFAKAGVDRERGWNYLKKTCLRKKYFYPDLVATRKTYDRMYNRVTPDMDYRDSFRL